MPNGRNPERIFARNTDKVEYQQLLPHFGRNAEYRSEQEMKAFLTAPRNQYDVTSNCRTIMYQRGGVVAFSF